MAKIRDEFQALLLSRPGRFLSGQEAAKKLSVSRAAVWKAAEALRAEGLPLEAVKGRGYRLAAKGDFLTEAALQTLLPGAPVRVLQQVDSTNREAKRWALDGAPHGAVVAAQSQSAGRGRMGRTFASPPGGLYMSVVLRPGPGKAGLSLLTAATAVAVCEAVQALCGKNLKIKWVNDLYYENKKCCGILTEGVAGLESGDFEYLVAGVGINYTTPATAFAQEIRGRAASLYPQGEPAVSRALLAADIHTRLLALFSLLPRADFLAEYRRRNLVPGRRVRVLDTPAYEAQALYIDDGARLVVRTQTGEEKVLLSGEVSVLLKG
ncbi:biotin--[acetyl-CoA-carboxylase] ligase [Ruminococcaceae bacterium OttesenSCG-928-I18]|nr:biotin--[acetyl-CoA-carboxylase] ligase [Ruminococcaceae bacterium OttesenSCG-928-I18]